DCVMQAEHSLRASVCDCLDHLPGQTQSLQCAVLHPTRRDAAPRVLPTIRAPCVLLLVRLVQPNWPPKRKKCDPAAAANPVLCCRVLWRQTRRRAGIQSPEPEASPPASSSSLPCPARARFWL